MKRNRDSCLDVYREKLLADYHIDDVSMLDTTAVCASVVDSVLERVVRSSIEVDEIEKGDETSYVKLWLEKNLVPQPKARLLEAVDMGYNILVGETMQCCETVIHQWNNGYKGKDEAKHFDEVTLKQRQDVELETLLTTYATSIAREHIQAHPESKPPSVERVSSQLREGMSSSSRSSTRRRTSSNEDRHLKIKALHDMFDNMVDDYTHDDVFLDRLDTVAEKVRSIANVKSTIAIRLTDLHRIKHESSTTKIGVTTKEIWKRMKAVARDVASRVNEKAEKREGRAGGKSSSTDVDPLTKHSGKIVSRHLIKFLKYLNRAYRDMDSRAICAEFFPAKCELKSAL